MNVILSLGRRLLLISVWLCVSGSALCQDPASPTPPPAGTVEELFPDLPRDALEQALREKVLEDKYVLKGLIDEQLKRAREMDGLVATLGEFRRNNPATWAAEPADLKAREQREAFRVQQFSRLENLENAVQLVDSAAQRAAADAKRPAADAKRLEWLLLARTHLRLVRSIPRVKDLLPIAQQECEKAVKLRQEASDDTRKRYYAEALDLRASYTKDLGKSGSAFAEARQAASQYSVALEMLAQSWDKKFETQREASPAFRRWTAWMQEQADPDLAPRPIPLRPWQISTRQRPIFQVKDINQLVPWPFTLAEQLQLGRLRFGYDVLGFDIGDGMNTAGATVIPRVRVRAEFIPSDPKYQPIVATDYRLAGAPIPLTNGPPDEVRERTKDPSFTAMAPPELWMRELTANLQDNKAVDKLIGDYWAQHLDDAWYDALTPKTPPRAPLLIAAALAAQDPRGAAVNLAATGRWPLPAEAGQSDMASIMSLCASAMDSGMEDVRALVLSDLKNTPHWQHARATAAAFRASYGKAGFDPRAIRLPEEIVAAHDKQSDAAWRSYFAAMLPVPLPARSAVVHPWPEYHQPPVVGWQDSIVWMRDARRDLEDKFDVLLQANDKSAPTAAVCDATRDLEELILTLTPGLRDGLGLADWRFAFQSTGSNIPSAADEDVVRAVGLGNTELARLEAELARVKNAASELQYLSAEASWLSNVLNTMKVPDKVLLPRLALPPSSPVPPPVPLPRRRPGRAGEDSSPAPPPVPPPPAQFPGFDMSMAAADVLEQRDKLVPVIRSRATDLRLRLRAMHASLRELITGLAGIKQTYPPPSEENAAASVALESAGAIQKQEVGLAERVESYQDADLWSGTQSVLRKAAAAYAKESLPKYPVAISTREGFLDYLQRVGPVSTSTFLMDTDVADRIERAWRWRAHALAVGKDGVPADEKIAKAFHNRALQLQSDHPGSVNLLVGPPDGYAIDPTDLTGIRYPAPLAAPAHGIAVAGGFVESPDHKLIAVPNLHTVIVTDSNNKKVLEFSPLPSRGNREPLLVSELAFSPRSDAIACGTPDGSVTLWKVSPVTQEANWRYGPSGSSTAAHGPTVKVTFSADGQKLNVQYLDGQSVDLDSATGKVITSSK